VASDENIFSNLNPKTLTSVTATDINTTTRDVHIERKNLDALKTSVLVNDATFRTDGGIIPGTIEVVNVAYDDNQYYTVKEPNAGEVWMVMTAWTFTATGFAGANLAVYDGTNRIYVADWGSGGGDLPDAGWGGPIYIDENCTLQYYPSGTLSSASSMQCLLGRVR